MKRREFLRSTAILAAASGVNSVAQAAPTLSTEMPEARPDDEKPAEADAEPKPLLASPPMLQNYAETTMGVAFAVSDMANGYVLLSENPDMSGARKVKCGGFRVTDISDRVILVRLTDLKPSTTYYYRIGADRIEYKGGYHMKVVGNEEDPRTYHFTTAGSESPAHFCVINDTHVRWEPFGAAIDKVVQLAPSCVIWNGDASNTEETIESQMRIYFQPEITHKDYAACTPFLFCPGNHDLRGMANRHLERVWMYRQAEERSPRDWDLGRNFAVRMGDIAMIGLDTGEDKLDNDKRFAGLFNSEAYREAQAAWLRDALMKPEIAKAPFLVAFCHIPLFDPRPKVNPGDVPPEEAKDKYTADFAGWQRTCSRLWTPLLEQAGCQVIITAHQHVYRYDAPSETRSWAHIVGGGPIMGFTGEGEKRREAPNLFPTVIEGAVRDGRLHITVHNCVTGQIQDTFSYAPKKKRRGRRG
ncbi:MAG: metallophosphoesterase [Bacteroidaceae bacterium]|nr:metallophosphoesterase [Bacteroidaceae bacterium]